MFQTPIKFIASLFFLLTSYATTALAEKIIVYSDDANAPVVYLEKATPKGILPDIFTLISKSNGDTYELTLLPWTRALQEAGQSKGGITNFSFTKERAVLYDFSEPIYNADLHLVVLKGKEFAFKELNNLKGKTVGGGRGTSYGGEIDQAISDGLFVVDRDPQQVSRMLKLLHGRVDVAIIGLAAFNLLLTSNPELKANKDKFLVLPNPLTSDPVHLAFLKTMNMKPALARFDKALIELKKTKEYKQIVSRKE